MMYIRLLGIATSRWINAAVGGDPDEMLSARAWRERDIRPWLVALIDAVYFFDENHCQECLEIERERRQPPPNSRLSGRK